jgi:CRISPR/Cas system-associated exonuclease Cas4 (RecB family)
MVMLLGLMVLVTFPTFATCWKDAIRSVAKQRVIRASEIGAYVYCHRAWWLRTVGGIEPDDRARFDRGIEAHHRHGTVCV